MSSEKAALAASSSMALPTWQPQQQQELSKKQRSFSPARLVLKGLALWVVGYVAAQALYQVAETTDVFHRHHQGVAADGKGGDDQSVCAQSPTLHPSRYNVTNVYSSEAKSRIVDWLSGAVQIPTESFDTMGPIGEDSRWDVFAPFHEYLENKFPKVYEHLKVDKVSTYALAYEWTGSDKSKKPLMLTAHQDVVPVEPSTVDAWTHPPFSGHYDGKYIWGRGSGDDKAGLIGILSAIELLLESGFQPERSVVLAFGMDEETGGKVGALSLGHFLEKKYGKDSMYMLVDEGTGLMDQYGQTFAMPSVGEKGYLDVELSVSTPGGHSSVPPAHTGIGLLAKAISELEANPVPLKLTRESPFYAGFQCVVKYGGKGIPSEISKLFKRAQTCKRALRKLGEKLASLSPIYKASMTTTRAVDIVRGGVKVNALPELSTAVINHRINADSSVGELQEQMISVLQPLADEYQLSFSAFGKDIKTLKNAKGSIKMAEAYHSALEPAPISPHDVSSPAWNLLSGSVKSTWATGKTGDEGEIMMAPALGIGNTDTKRYWSLTRNIYRFGYLLPDSGFNIHTVDEHVKADAILEGVRFFQTLILNADEARD